VIRYTNRQKDAIVRAAESFVRAHLRLAEERLNGGGGHVYAAMFRNQEEIKLIREVVRVMGEQPRAKPARAAGRRKQ
jgi:hypothetical protein